MPKRNLTAHCLSAKLNPREGSKLKTESKASLLHMEFVGNSGLENDLQASEENKRINPQELITKKKFVSRTFRGSYGYRKKKAPASTVNLTVLYVHAFNVTSRVLH